jgi:hypothetical protein
VDAEHPHRESLGQWKQVQPVNTAVAGKMRQDVPSDENYLIGEGPNEEHEHWLTQEPERFKNVERGVSRWQPPTI